MNVAQTQCGNISFAKKKKLCTKEKKCKKKIEKKILTNQLYVKRKRRVVLSRRV